MSFPDGGFFLNEEDFDPKQKKEFKFIRIARLIIGIPDTSIHDSAAAEILVKDYEIMQAFISACGLVGQSITTLKDLLENEAIRTKYHPYLDAGRLDLIGYNSPPLVKVYSRSGTLQLPISEAGRTGTNFSIASLAPQGWQIITDPPKDDEGRIEYFSANLS